MKKGNGFTLIELLAVIAILAILAIITTPVVIQLIEKSSKGTAQNSAYGLISAARNYHAVYMADQAVTAEKVITFPTGLKELKFKGATPESGTLKIRADGKTYLAVQYGNYCANKDYTVDKVTIKEKTGTSC